MTTLTAADTIPTTSVRSAADPHPGTSRRLRFLGAVAALVVVGAGAGYAAHAASTAPATVVPTMSIHGIADAVASGDLPRRGAPAVASAGSLARTGTTTVEARHGHGPVTDPRPGTASASGPGTTTVEARHGHGPAS